MNPTGQPMMGVPQPPAPSSAAKDAVNLPSIFIIILGALSAVMALMGAMGGGMSGQQLQLIEQMMRDMQPEQQKLVRELMSMSQSMRIPQLILGLGCAGFMIFGGLQMRNLKSWGLVLAADIVTLVPCTNCCYCLGIPLGIWALIVLNKPEVKSAFS